MLESARARWKLSRLIREWLEFRRLADQYLGAQEVPDLEETRFLNLKASIARKLPLLENAVPPGLAKEAAQHHRAMNELLTGLISLRTDHEVPGEDRQELMRQWHAHFLFLSALSGVTLKAQSGPEPNLSSPAAAKPAVPTGMPVFRAPERPQRSPASVLRTIVGGVALFLIGYLLVIAVGVRMQRNWPAVEEYGTASRQLWDAMPGRVVSFLEPVVTSYGVEMTVALLGVLLLSVGYWVFIRGR